MSRHLDRLFTQAFTGEEAKAAPAPRRPAPAPGPEAEEAEEAADPSEPARIIAAHKRRDYAACLGLEPVTLDALGRPQWEVTDSALSRAFRKRSLRVHPDKNPSPEARLAFDALNAAQRHLLDHNNRMEYVREEGERQLQKLTSDQPDAMMRIKKAREAAAAEEYAADVRAQAERQAERAKLRKEQAAARAAARAAQSDDESDSEEEGAGAPRAAGGAALRGRGRGKRGRGPSFIF